MADIETLVTTLRTGTPRARYYAREELSTLGAPAEAPLVRVLAETTDPELIVDVLHVLTEVKVSEPAAVDLVVRRLTHKQWRVRAAAAACLLHGSPRLRPFLPEIRAALDREENEGTKEALRKLLERYP